MDATANKCRKQCLTNFALNQKMSQQSRAVTYICGVPLQANRDCVVQILGCIECSDYVI